MTEKHFMSAIILAAGKSERMGTNKMTMNIGAKSVIERTIEAFEEAESVDEIIIAAHGETLLFTAELVKANGYAKVVAVTEGGATRQESVKNALAEVSEDAEYIAVHDGARLLIKPQAIDLIFDAAQQYGAAAAATRCTDTVKSVDDSMMIESTIDREHTVTVQTPQIFRADMLKEAHRKALEDGFSGTDECMLAERLGKKIKAVEVKDQNIKLTYPEDVTYAMEILKARGRL